MSKFKDVIKANPIVAAMALIGAVKVVNGSVGGKYQERINVALTGLQSVLELLGAGVVPKQ